MDRPPIGPLHVRRSAFEAPNAVELNDVVVVVHVMEKTLEIQETCGLVATLTPA